MKKNFMNETRWPNKIGEYMASGRPTVVSDVGDVAEVVEKYGIGLVAKPGADSFAEKMQILFSNEKAAVDMGVRAREVACEKYSWAEMAIRLEAIYFQLIKTDEKLRIQADEASKDFES
jgi:glycosyltransferase involved in cell wall biosynthesis